MPFNLTSFPAHSWRRPLIACGLSFWLVFAGSVGAGGKEWVGGYSSSDSGTRPSPSDERLYPLHRLENLRRAVPPRYVRVLDWQEYAQSAQVVHRGILFTYADYRADQVLLAGNFSNWQPIAMRRNQKGVFYHIVPIREIEAGVRFTSRDQIYRYKFLVDGIWTHDPVNKNRVDDGLGAFYSEYIPTGEDVPKTISVRVLSEAGERDAPLVEFAIYLPDVKNLALVGTFNRWNPEHDLPVKGKDGVFRLRMRLKPGAYAYKYIADGRWILDQYNPNTRYFAEIGEVCSFVSIK